MRIKVTKAIFRVKVSLYISPAVVHFYGTGIEILAEYTGPKFGQHREHLHCIGGIL
jgi:hypothetical protein